MEHTLRSLVSTLLVLSILCTVVPAAVLPSHAQEVGSGISPTSLPVPSAAAGSVMFIENVGQWNYGARFQVRGGPADATWLAENTIWLTLIEPADPERASSPSERDIIGPKLAEEPLHAAAIRLSFVGANAHPIIEPFDRLETVVSYFLGSDAEKWRPNVPVWGGVRYIDLYPGIDLELTGEDGLMVPRLEARPGADLSVVTLRVEGAGAVKSAGDSLALHTTVGDTTWPLLRADAWIGDAVVQSLGTQSCDVASPFAPKDPRRPTPIVQVSLPEDNPDHLLYGTFLGGSGDESSNSIAVDGTGAAYLAGSAYSGFPTTPGAFDPSFNGGSKDAFVVKLDQGGSTLEYATFLGGSGDDYGYAIAVDATGSAYVTGETKSSGFPTTPGAFDRSYGGTYGDAFATKLSPSGGALAYSTFLGGSLRDGGAGIAVSESGAAYISGTTWASNFPTTPGAFDATHNGLADAFLAGFNESGSALVYATYLGGTDYDYGVRSALDGGGAAYITGVTDSSDFPTTPGAFNTVYNFSDAFVSKIDATGSDLVYSTFLGGSNGDCGEGIVIDGFGAAYVAGYTLSDDFPITLGAYDTSYNGEHDAFVAKLNAAGSALDYATFLGGAAMEDALDVGVDGSGHAYVAGYTESIDFPTLPGAFDTSFDSGDAFAVKLSPTGSALDYATFLGGSSWDNIHGVAVTEAGDLVVTGNTNSSNFPTTLGAFDTVYNGGAADGVVAKLRLWMPPRFSISGRVDDNGGLPLSDVQVSAGGVYSGTTDILGQYEITDLITGTYTLQPEKPGYVFAPLTLTVTVPPDATAEDFVGTVVTYPISGRVTYPSGEGAPDVTVSAGGVYSFVTDADGYYSLSLPMGTYTLAPTRDGYTFIPPSIPINVPNDAGQDFAVASWPLQMALADLAAQTQVMLDLIKTEAWNAAQDGDYFSTQLTSDKVSLIVDDILNSFDLLAIPLGSLDKTKDAAKMALPGVEGCSWGHIVELRQTFEPARALLREQLQIPIQSLSGANITQAAREILKNSRLFYTYYAADMIDQGAEAITLELIRKGYESALSVDTGLQTQFYPHFEQLADAAFKPDLVDTYIDVLAQLPTLTAEEEALYVADLDARRLANQSMVSTLELRGQPLHYAQDDREVGQDLWFSSFLVKYAIKQLAFLGFDGPGLLAASAGAATWDLYKNTRKMEQDLQMMDMSVEMMTSAVDTATRIYMNSVNGMDAVKNLVPPQQAAGYLGFINNRSAGEYKLFGKVHWVEAESYTDVEIYNSSEYESLVQVSASYGAEAGFMGAGLRLLSAEGQASIPPHSLGTVRVHYRQGSLGESPKEYADISFAVLASTATGTYYIAYAYSSWVPDRVTTLGQPVKPPVGVTADEISTLPNPVRTQIGAALGALTYTPSIWVENPFTQTVTVQISQSIPIDIEVVDANGGTVDDSAIVWQTDLEPSTSSLITCTIEYEGEPGVTVTYPGAEVEMSDIAQTQSITFTSNTANFTSKTRLTGEGTVPIHLAAGEYVTVPITVTNLSSSAAVTGTVNVTVTALDGTSVYTHEMGVDVPASGQVPVELPLEVQADGGYYVIRAAVESDGADYPIVSEYLEISEPTQVFLVSFDAAPQDVAILITWETSQEIDNLGFNLYRAESSSGPMTRLNDTLIPTQVPPGSPFGATYEWLDEDELVPGQVYYYWLEDVDLHGNATMHGPTHAQAGPRMHVGPIALRNRVGRDRYVLSAKTTTLDSAGKRIAGATVSIRWTLPDLSTIDQQATSNARGVVSFRVIGTLAGTYQFCVTDVLKPGWVYDPEQNRETCDTLTIP